MVYTLFDSSYAIGMVSGSLLGSALYENGIKPPFILTGLLMLAISPLLYAVGSQDDSVLVTVSAGGSPDAAVYEAVCVKDDDQQAWEISRHSQSAGSPVSAVGSYQGGEHALY